MLDVVVVFCYKAGGTDVKHIKETFLASIYRIFQGTSGQIDYSAAVVLDSGQPVYSSGSNSAQLLICCCWLCELLAELGLHSSHGLGKIMVWNHK
jgi:hypothetical protein